MQKGQLTDCQVVEAFMKATARRDRPGYISMEELYTQVRTKVRVSIEDFKSGMLEFYDKHVHTDYGFSHGSSIRSECRKYGFLVDGKYIFYMIHHQVERDSK